MFFPFDIFIFRPNSGLPINTEEEILDFFQRQPENGKKSFIKNFVRIEIGAISSNVQGSYYHQR
jgi:hypothetical protein